MRIFDCSNSCERPQTRGFGGSKENSVVSMLKKYSCEYNAEFVQNIDDCDIIFTNDIFPSSLRNSKKPKIKRMDGIFWQKSLRDRNIPFVESCQIADCVIFISQYSKEQYFNNWKPIPYEIVLNWVDNKIFPLKKGFSPLRNIACIATDWSRPEKRLHDIELFTSYLLKKENMYFIGKNDNKILFPNKYILDFQQEYSLSSFLQNMDALVNFSYRDAAPKVVCEAISCGLPVFYTDSGGTGELVKDCGVGVIDFAPSFLEERDSSPPVFFGDIRQKFDYFKRIFPSLQQRTLKRQNETKRLLDEYFDIFRRFL